jgi:hypothetical protein
MCRSNADNDWKWCQYEVDVADEKGHLVEQQLLQGACCECPPAFLEHDDEGEGEDSEEREDEDEPREHEREDEDETDASSVTGMFKQLFDTVKDDVEGKLEGHEEDQDDQKADHDTNPKDDTASAPGFAPSWQPVRLHINGDKFSNSKAADAVWHKLYAKTKKPTTGAPAPAPGFAPGWEPVRIHVKGDKFSDSKAADAAWHKLYGQAKKPTAVFKPQTKQHKTVYTAGGMRWELSLPKFTLLRPGETTAEQVAAAKAGDGTPASNLRGKKSAQEARAALSL